MTGSLAAHAIYSLNNPLTQAEVLGMNYVSAGTVTRYRVPGVTVRF